MHECNETRCYGWQDNRKMQKNVKNNACKRVITDREAVKLLSRWNLKISMDRESIKDVLSRQRAQDFGSMDRPIFREDVEVKLKNLNRRGIYQEAI